MQSITDRRSMQIALIAILALLAGLTLAGESPDNAAHAASESKTVEVRIESPPAIAVQRDNFAIIGDRFGQYWLVNAEGDAIEVRAERREFLYWK